MKQGQSKLMSWAEAGFNIVVGYSIALIGQLIVFPLMGIIVTLGQNIIIGLIFTVISIVRLYTIRRFFNWWHHKNMR